MDQHIKPFLAYTLLKKGDADQYNLFPNEFYDLDSIEVNIFVIYSCYFFFK